MLLDAAHTAASVADYFQGADDKPFYTENLPTASPT